MEQLWTIASALGGIGLFLLGMWLMTEGLKVAAGPALQSILERQTRTPLRGLGSGFVLTGIVQSSSAVTVATIGFVNAGLLTLTQSVWVLYGANLGTTVTSWLVALAGAQIRIDAFALPMIGAGMLLRVIRSGHALGSWGQAVAGFGVFFLGIVVLKDAFASVSLLDNAQALTAENVQSVLIFVLVGIVLAFLTQSSSATIAIALTALAGGALAMEPAAAMVIGASVGTTTTALIATIGATANAKRVALCHVAFNVVTGIVALIILPLLVLVVDRLVDGRDVLDTAMVHLAVFHTVFKTLGILIMWPLTNRLIRLVSGLFVTVDETAARPRYLDSNVMAVPQLAAKSVFLETQRLGEMVLAAASLAIDPPLSRTKAIPSSSLALARTIRNFVGMMNRTPAAGSAVRHLPDALRALQHYQEIATITGHLAAPSPLGAMDFLATGIRTYRASTLHAINESDTVRDSFNLEAADRAWAEVETGYQALKHQILEAAAAGEIEIDAFDAALDRIALWRRVAYCAVRAARRLSAWDDQEAPVDPVVDDPTLAEVNDQA